MHQVMQEASLGHLLCCKDSICKEGGTGWGVWQVGLTGELELKLIAQSSCMPSSHDQNLLLVSHLPILC